MKKLPVLLMTALLALLPLLTASAELKQSAILDAAFECVEESNAFLARYQQLTGSTTAARLRLGVPYFYGGDDVKYPFANEPEYTARKAWQSSPSGFYQSGKSYLAGFDCTGFIKYVYSRAGNAFKNKISSLSQSSFHKKGYHVWCSDLNPMPESWTELAVSLQPGDLWIVRHPGLHVMMFIGTLRDFGYTEEDLPELGDYLDYPLIIHCGAHPDYGDRLQTCISESDRNWIRLCKTTNGGVAVSILGVPLEEAPNTTVAQGNELHWFNVEGTSMTTWDDSGVESYVWFRK